MEIILRSFFFVLHYVDSYIVFVLALLLLWYFHKAEKKRARIILFITALIVVTPHVTIWSNFIFMLLVSMAISSY
ncbi:MULTISPECIES: hypothetical protein [Proteus]|uniref:hypothetical protein n=1 Tax=Proteus TaxID=583 RepID=UPI000BFD70D0|nr:MULTISPECIES: hypothetical protein [Proteus]ATM99840.1 hypothetical protein CRN77_08895 [Proteus vulgaris]MBG2836318.1 hypothetical protein [Proteus terrae subsp. cibarius]MBG2868432.1 hypothetical protein [Proteus terrae subsp. cibarius]MCO7049136.1 hypothetical protein [Proteus terrae]MCS6733040.1 hypothetical protein [Proteus terrae]